MTDLALTAHARGTILPVRARPGARKSAIVGVHAGALRVSVTAPPDKGRANAALLAFLADTLCVKRGESVNLLSGETNREKRFLVEGVTPEELRRRIEALLPPDLFDPEEGTP